MRSEEEAKKLIESLLPMQEKPRNGYVFPCPRCDYDRMNPVVLRNPLSRRANVYICNECGTDEAMLDMAGKPPLPFTEWGMVKGFDEDETEDDESEDE